ncbi:MAG: small conductance mechanosensitive channel [Solirubrobacteraceae bacterium]|jgi:small-conductance mechanosensitive channel|nr:small conductance mechanosensitive channel [Solirubrobacteraceae bacterium]
MPSYIVAESFVSRYDDAIRAVVTVLVVVLLLALVNRWIARRGERIASAVAGGDLRPEAATRLRFLRRVVDATIVVIGLAVALSNFTALDRLMGTVLASSAIAAAVIGFAARQTLANAIAGLLLAITQPLRIGDHVTFEGETGVVEDVRLTYTWLRSGTDARIIVPNERLAAGVLRNDSIVHATVGVEASIWLAAEDDALGALDALRESLPGATVRVAETTPEGVRLLLVGEPVTPGDRAVQEAVLREAALRALRDPAVSATP